MPRKSVSGAASGASAPNTPSFKPRKSLTNHSTPSAAAAAAADADPSTSTLTIPPSTKLVLKQQETALKGIESFELPRSNIIKCAKSDIPDSVQLRKEVQQALVKSATVFISYLTATAHDNATKKKGKIITAQHVLDAVRQIDFGEEDLVEMKGQLKGYRENAARKKSEKAAGGAGEKKTAQGVEGENDADVSRFDGVEEEPDQSVRLDDDAADASMLRKSLHAQDDADEDQLMDED
ncbi:related to dna polymerase epsilon p17 subunit [Sporisorium scitamineum]|uniref:DNA polymerase epsilon subunit D n=1 Tax=Sporisorium scitamineum TaxID=49012 RepID=A0A127Z3S4_9BASI|nr:related to dna polymerase epsilon p17 subunit [Sporisorium scitamineum]